MKTFHFLLIPVLILLIAAACRPAPSPIAFGSDMCHDCKMTIVDPQHAAELVTAKGKVMKFDAIECMIHHTAANPGAQYAFQLVMDYQQPESWLNASESHFLICEQIPSPMGAFLSALNSAAAAEAIQKAKGGQVHGWDSIQEKIGAHAFSHRR